MKRFLQILVLLAGVVLLFTPATLIISGLTGGIGYFNDPQTTGTEITYVFVRICALSAFFIIFMQVVTSSFRRIFEKLYSYDAIQVWHTTGGITALVIATIHPILLYLYLYLTTNLEFLKHLPNYFGDHFQLFTAIGETQLALLWATVFVALFRRKLAKFWRQIHIINYIVFMLVIIHSINIGTDVPYGIFPIFYWSFAIIVLISFVYRIYEMKVKKIAVWFHK